MELIGPLCSFNAGVERVANQLLAWALDGHRTVHLSCDDASPKYIGANSSYPAGSDTHIGALFCHGHDILCNFPHAGEHGNSISDWGHVTSDHCVVKPVDNR